MHCTGTKSPPQILPPLKHKKCPGHTRLPSNYCNVPSWRNTPIKLKHYDGTKETSSKQSWRFHRKVDMPICNLTDIWSIILLAKSRSDVMFCLQSYGTYLFYRFELAQVVVRRITKQQWNFFRFESHSLAALFFFIHFLFIIPGDGVGGWTCSGSKPFTKVINRQVAASKDKFFALMLNFSVMSGQFPIFMGWTSTKQQIS